MVCSLGTFWLTYSIGKQTAYMLAMILIKSSIAETGEGAGSVKHEWY
jgi:hypothetical protein